MLLGVQQSSRPVARHGFHAQDIFVELSMVHDASWSPANSTEERRMGSNVSGMGEGR
jgi:hypothetical protein